MNRRQKLVQQQFLNNEKAVIKRLEYIYDGALSDINKKIRELEFHIGDLTEVYDWMEDDDPQKEVIRSRIQSKIYQKQYQESLQGQVDGILKQMQTKQFLTVSDYLDTCYEDGFIGSLFDLHGQDVPLLMPLDQTKMVRAIQLDSKISKGLYTRLGEDVTTLKKRITAEVTRSIATGTSYAQTAQRLAGQTKIGYNKAVRIARTEGHRIQTTAAMDVMEGAKERGADVLKQWDAALDDRTRESHIAVDGEIREVDKPFSNGLMYPGDPAGGAAEVINCRCALLQRARWALDEDELQTLKDRAEYFGLDKSDQFNDFKKNYLKAVQTPEEKYGGLSYDELTNIVKDKEKQLKNLQALKSQEELNVLMGTTVEDMQKARQKVLELQKQIAGLTSETDEIREIWKMKKPVKKIDPAKLDDFPEVFRKNSASKKATQTFVDALNEAEDLDPNIRKLYTHMGDLGNLPSDCTISYTAKGHALESWYRPSTGQVTRCKLKVPKMQGDDLMGQKATAFHEMGHLIDLGAGKNGKAVTKTYQKVTDAVRSSGWAMSDDAKDLFKDFEKQYQKVKSNLQATYGAKRQVLIDEYKAGQITWSDYNKQWKALIREESADKDYQCRNLCGGGVSMLSDIYDALSGGQYQDSGKLIYGHGGRYFSRSGAAESEIFANYMSLSVNRPDLIDILREDKPDLCSALDQMIEEMAGGIK